MSLKLYGANVCPFVHRVRLVLEEKGLEHDYVSIDLANKPDWYHEVLPTGRVPLLEHKGARIWESAIVCEYLEDAFSEPALTPSDPAEKAKMRLLIDWIGSKFVPPYYKLLAAQEQDTQEEHRGSLEEALRELEERLGETEGPYFLESLSLADLELYPWFERMCVLEHYRNFQISDEFSRVKNWRDTLASRRSASATAEPSSYFIEQYEAYAVGAKVPS